MDKNIKEKERLFQWACKYDSIKLTEKIFTPIDSNKDSYFTKREETGNYLHKYKFQDLPELRNELEKMWNEEDYMMEIMTTVLAGAYKNRIEICEEIGEAVNGTGDAEELSPYIYNF